MSELKKKVIHEIIEPTRERFKISTLIGKVVKSYNYNKCKVDFTDKNGNKFKAKMVPIRYYSDINYLPSVNDKVIIRQEENEFEIIGIYNSTYENYQQATKLKGDIYSNFISDTSPGYIY